MIGDGAGTSVEDGEAVALVAHSAKIADYSKGRRGRSLAIMARGRTTGVRPSRMVSTNDDRRRLAKARPVISVAARRKA